MMIDEVWKTEERVRTDLSTLLCTSIKGYLLALARLKCNLSRDYQGNCQEQLVFLGI